MIAVFGSRIADSGGKLPLGSNKRESTFPVLGILQDEYNVIYENGENKTSSKNAKISGGAGNRTRVPSQFRWRVYVRIRPFASRRSKRWPKGFLSDQHPFLFHLPTRLHFRKANLLL